MINRSFDCIVEEELKKNPIVTVKINTIGFPNLILSHPSEQVINLLLLKWKTNEVEKYIEERHLLVSLTTDNPHKEAYQLLTHLSRCKGVPNNLKLKIIKPAIGSKLWLVSKFNTYALAINIVCLTLNLIAWLASPQTVPLLGCIITALCLIITLFIQSRKTLT